MKTFLLGLVVSISLLAVQAKAADRVNNREARQGARIHQGVKSGTLTAAEAARLKKQQKRIRGAERRAGADGQVTDAEKARLEHMQDHASKSIERKKSNDRNSDDKSATAPTSGESEAAPKE